jgi:hypothetical protein
MHCSSSRGLDVEIEARACGEWATPTAFDQSVKRVGHPWGLLLCTPALRFVKQLNGEDKRGIQTITIHVQSIRQYEDLPVNDYMIGPDIMRVCTLTQIGRWLMWCPHGACIVA